MHSILNSFQITNFYKSIFLSILDMLSVHQRSGKTLSVIFFNLVTFEKYTSFCATLFWVGCLLLRHNTQPNHTPHNGT